jgi:tetratricopeptide (TPR) repeat protein/V8-like Glu-specific endopeptidase
MKYSLLLPIVGAIALYAPATHALSAQEVAKVAKQSTIRIENATSPGSGVIIKKEGNSYTVLTAAHVVRNRRSAFKAVAFDGGGGNISDIKEFPGRVDLAIVRFSSNNNYAVAKLAKNSSEVTEGSTVYVSGFPVSNVITDAIFNFTEGKVSANSSRPLSDGYSLVYNNNTLPGHSGGPVWNERGEVVAIHGKGDIDTKQKTSEINPNIRVKTGFNLGISINTFAQLSGRVGLNGFGGAAVVATNNKSRPVDDLLVTGLAKLQSRNFSGAIADFDRVIQLEPNRATAYQYRGRAKAYSLEEKVLKDSAYISNLYAQMLNDFDQDAELLLYKQFNKELRSALTDYNQAFKLDPSSRASLQGAAEMRIGLGEYPQAIQLLNRALQLKPEAETYAFRASAKLKQNDTAGATQDISKAISLDKKNPSLYNIRASIYNKQQQFGKAIQDYDQAMRLVPKTERYQILGYSISRATAKSNAKDFKGALADMTAVINSKAAKDSPALTSTFYLLRGSYNFNLERYPAALQDLNVAVQQDQSNSAIYFFRGAIYLKQEKYPSAQADLKKSVQLAPDFAEAHILLGATYTVQKNWSSSLTSLDRGIQLAENKPSKQEILAQGYEVRGYTHFLNGNRPQAIRDLEKSAQIYKVRNNSAKYKELQSRLASIRKQGG